MDEQEIAISVITRSQRSFRKRPREEMTVAHVEGRRFELMQAWNKCKRLDVKINAATKGSDKSLIPNFSNNILETAEEIYLQTLDVYNETIANINASSNQNSVDNSRSTSIVTSGVCF